MARSQEEILQDILSELRNDRTRRPRDQGGSNRTSEQEGTVAASIKALTEKIGSGLGVGFNIAGDLAGKALDQTATVSDATGAVAQVLGKFGTFGGIAGDALKGLTAVLTDAVDNWQRFSDSGLQFGGNAIAMNEAVKKTGLTFGQYENLLQTAIPGFAAFGKGLSAGAEYFGEASKMMLDTFGNQLGKLGMGSVKDLNSVLAITARGMQTIDPANGGLELLTNKAMKLAYELDKTAQLTGVSRKEQEKNIQAMQDDMRVQAQLARMRRTDPQKAEQIQASINAASVYGPEMQKIITEGIAGRGVIRSEKLGELTSVIGPELTAQLTRALRETTSNDPRIAAQAAETIRRTFGDMSMARGSANSGAAFVQQGALAGDIARELYAGANNRSAIFQANMDKFLKEENGDMIRARARANKVIENNQRGILNEDITINGVTYKAGRDQDPRAQSTEVIVGIEQDIKRIGTGLTEMITEVNNLLMGKRTKDGKSIGQESSDFIRNQVVVGKNPDGSDKLRSNVSEFFRNSREQMPTWFSQPANQGVLDPLEQAKKILNGPKPVNPTPVAPTSPSAAPITPVSQAQPRGVEVKVSAAEPASTAKNKDKEGAPTPVSDQEQVIAKLAEISTIMARVEQNTKNTARHTQDTASNIERAGPYVA